MISDALFSPCGRYRWKLTRHISNSQKELIFIGLNPSSAGFVQNDSTLKRIIGFCKFWGYGSLTVINLFGKIAKSPKHLALEHEPIGWRNDYELNKNISYWARNNLCDLWIGWGIHGKLNNRNIHVLQRIKKVYSKTPYVIGITKDGHPRHPLYISKKRYLYPIPKTSECLD